MAMNTRLFPDSAIVCQGVDISKAVRPGVWVSWTEKRVVLTVYTYINIHTHGVSFASGLVETAEELKGI